MKELRALKPKGHMLQKNSSLPNPTKKRTKRSKNKKKRESLFKHHL